MALVKQLDKILMERNAQHEEVDCTYSIILGDKGEKLLQIDTYGSRERKIPGKKSQSLRFSPEAIEQLKQILKEL